MVNKILVTFMYGSSLVIFKILANRIHAKKLKSFLKQINTNYPLDTKMTEWSKRKGSNKNKN